MKNWDGGSSQGTKIDIYIYIVILVVIVGVFFLVAR